MSLKLEDVFVTGGQPSVTYVSRDEQGLETSLARYLKVGKRVLAVSGPSKSGKTTLVNKVLRETGTPFFRVTGSSLVSMDRLWEILAHQAALSSSSSVTKESLDSVSGEFATKAGGSVIPFELSSKFVAQVASREQITESKAVATSEAVRDLLASNSAALVIDDFHHAPEDVRTVLAKELKDLVFAGARVILVAIPERVMQVLQDEGELVGRVRRLRVEPWEPVELLRIALLGFEALNIEDEDGDGSLAGRLVEQSYGSPLLMQALCERLCENADVWEWSAVPQRIRPPHWEDFFRELSSSLQPSVIEHLRVGPVQRRRRTQRPLANGDTVDLYSAVLLAISKQLPARQMTPLELSDQMTQFLLARPKIGDVRRACREMANIAYKHRGQSDAALDFSASPERLSVVDPYLAYFIAWGLRGLQLPVISTSAGA